MDYFRVNVSTYDSSKEFVVTRPASMNNPKDHSVMFIQKKYLSNASKFAAVFDCLIFWPDGVEVPVDISSKHAVCICKDPHIEFCRFFKDHGITNYVQPGEIVERDHYITCGNVEIGEGTKVFPYVYINGNVTIGKNCYIGAGTKIIGNVYIGDDVLIRENAVIGADGLTTDRDENGEAVTMPQFGGVIIEDNVQIGASVVIERGAIDNTVIKSGCKLDNACFVAHNNTIGNNVFMVGESSTFGSVTIGDNTLISGNASIRQGLSVGKNCIVGVGSIVTRSVKDKTTVMGNPAKAIFSPGSR